MFFTASRRHLARGVAWKGDKAAAVGGTRAPAPGQRPQLCQLQSSVCKPSEGSPCAAMPPKQECIPRGAPSLRPHTRGLTWPRSGGAQGKGTLEWSGMQRRWEQPCRCSFLRSARLAADTEREGGKRGVRGAAGNASPRDGPAPALRGASRCRWPCPPVPPVFPGSKSATLVHLGSLFIPVPPPHLPASAKVARLLG